MESRFTIFSLPHVVLLLLLPAIAGGLAFWSISNSQRAKATRLALGIILLVNEVFWYIYYVEQDWFNFPYTLPLQLCDILVWIAIVTALTANQRAYELLYYWGLTGTTMALLTPDVTSPTFSYLTIRFFVSHGGIIVVLLFLTWSKTLQPRRGSWWQALLMLHAYAALIGLFNTIFATNYFYICGKPLEASLLDYMGPWPLYILAGDVLALGLFWLLSLPFRKRTPAPPEGP